MKRSNFTQAIAWAGLLVLGGEKIAYAYLDAGSGSMIIQLLLGGVAGIGMYVKLTWRKWRARFTKSSVPPPEQ